MCYIVIIYTVRTDLNLNENRFTDKLIIYLFIIHSFKLPIRIDNWFYLYKLKIFGKNEFESNQKFEDVAK